MNWKEIDNKLEKEFILKSFSQIIEKLNELTPVANKLNHHPDFSVYGFKKIKFALCTHDAGNTVTAKDHELAAKIDSIFEAK